MIVLCKISFVCIDANALQAHNEGSSSPRCAQTKHAKSLIISFCRYACAMPLERESIIDTHSIKSELSFGADSPDKFFGL